MKIPTKFELNTEDFKINFDNQKKTHVCESLDTGEKTNIGVLGILMQMGIIKPVEKGIDEKIKTLSERLNELETKINEIIKKVDSTSKTERSVEETETKEIEEQEEEIKPKSEIKKRIMKKVMETAEEPEIEEEPDEDEIEVVDLEAKGSDVKAESQEEIDNWLDI